MGHIEEGNDSLAVLHLADQDHDGHVGGHQLQVHLRQVKVQALHKTTATLDKCKFSPILLPLKILTSFYRESRSCPSDGMNNYLYALCGCMNTGVCVCAWCVCV